MLQKILKGSLSNTDCRNIKRGPCGLLRYSLILARAIPHEHPPKLHSVPCGQHQLPPTHRKSPVGQQPVSPAPLSSQMYPSGQSGTQPIGQHSSLVTKFTERPLGSAADPGVLGSGGIVTAVITKMRQDKSKNAKYIVVIDGLMRTRISDQAIAANEYLG